MGNYDFADSFKTIMSCCLGNTLFTWGRWGQNKSISDSFYFWHIFFVVLPVRAQWNGLYDSTCTQYDHGFIRGLHIPSTNIHYPWVPGHFSSLLILGTFCSCMFEDPVNAVFVQIAIHKELIK